ncbi:MAG: ATP-binding cassette domain-containing protein [Prevotella sp.]|nr:ATP-binding cassette domain-containing protein [Prevotella sp.]
MQATIRISNGITRMPKWRMAEPVYFEALADEHIAIVGRNGSGKSMLTDILIGRHPLLGEGPKYDFSPSTRPLASDNIKHITFRDCYGGDNDTTYYLQQRWNQHDIDEQTPTVGHLLEEAFLLTGDDTPARRRQQVHLYELFALQPLLDKYVILLSSGELRKFQLTKALFCEPRVLIIDNPFIGLDAKTREQLRTLLHTLSREREVQLILVLAKTDDIPDFITHVVEVKEMKVMEKTTREEYMARKSHRPARVLTRDKEEAIAGLPYHDNEYHTREVVRLHNVSIHYGERIILRSLDWTVLNGERWSLSGDNGSGKSTLLSLVCADNPQSYACDITLFDTPRGSGETIWDIKRHIGYVSPEMHRAYKKDLPAMRIVASGLKDSVGLYVHTTEAEHATCLWWMDIFGISHLHDRTFMSLSSGEQRLVLLARAFVKDPELLILDEPLHGLDDHNRQLVKDIIEAFCRRHNKTLLMVSHYEEEIPSCVTKRLHLVRN